MHDTQPIPNGRHLIAGRWTNSASRFHNTPLTGAPRAFAQGTPDLVDRAVRAAEDAFASYAATPRDLRAQFLERIADEIDARGDAITAIGHAETGLPQARLVGERGRTTGQLRYFAGHLREAAYLDPRHDPALPDRAPLPRPDLRLIQRPVGPVAVFGASNFPLAFSTAGGDTASALAAGCPVIVKGHEAHPGTSELVAEAILAAITALALDPGVFSLVHGGAHEVGQALVQHPLVQAVGFTGGLRGGRALFDLCCARPVPIPFFGELGSVNPMFILPHALDARGDAIAKGWAASLILGAGQFCTNPGVAILMAGAATVAFIETVTDELAVSDPQTMLTQGIADAYGAGKDRIGCSAEVVRLLSSDCGGRQALPSLFRTSGAQWLSDPTLAEEVFGPLGLIVVVDSVEEMHAVARGLEGQLTVAFHLDADDTQDARSLLAILERKAGRLLANGFPTGVEVADAMVHGGPYPASTNFGHTSVGILSIRRWLRPVCFQNMPDAILPSDLQGQPT